MADITLSQALGKYTNTLAEVYRQRISPTSFLRSKFPSKVSPTKLVSIFVQRGFEKVAVDCMRGTEGNRNKWSKSTEKIFEPLYFRENFNLTEMQLYDQLWLPRIAQNAPGLLALLNSIADSQMEQQEKIERAIEIMCSQVLMTGVIQMSSQGTGIQVDFKRKAASLIDSGAGNYFADNVDIFAQAQADATFLRTTGKTMGSEFDWILGETTMQNLLKNTAFTTRQNLFHLSLDGVVPPQVNLTIGAAYHGWISAGPYRINLITYPQYYDDIITGNSTPYIDPKKAIMLPKDNVGFTFFGAVPQVVAPNGMPMIGEFVSSDWVSQEKRAWLYEVESCPIVVPVKIDQMVTRKCVA